jgi:hypothetical protein
MTRLRDLPRQLSVEYWDQPGFDWVAQYTGIASYKEAKVKAEQLWAALRKQSPGTQIDVRICKTPFGRVLARSDVNGRSIPVPSRRSKR